MWAASRPLTYRAIDQLAADGLIAPVRTEPGHGPQRTVHELTAAGRDALADVAAHAGASLPRRAGHAAGQAAPPRARRALDAAPARRPAPKPSLRSSPRCGRRRSPTPSTRWRRTQAEAIAAFLDGAD